MVLQSAKRLRLTLCEAGSRSSLRSSDEPGSGLFVFGTGCPGTGALSLVHGLAQPDRNLLLPRVARRALARGQTQPLAAVLNRRQSALHLNPHMADAPLAAFHDAAHPEVDGAEMHLTGFIVHGAPMGAVDFILLMAPGGEVFLVVGDVSHPDFASLVSLPEDFAFVDPAPAFHSKQLPPHPWPEIDWQVAYSGNGEANVHG